MLEIDLRSLKRFRSGRRLRFVLASDFGGRVPDEDILREAARSATERLSSTGNGSAAAQWVMSRQGWAGWLNGWDDLGDAEEWFTTFAASFSRSEGKIIGGPREAGLPQLDPQLTPVGHLYLTTGDMRAVDSDERGWYWGVEEAITRYACEQMMYFVHQPRATEWIATDAEDSFETQGLDHAQSMTEMGLAASSLQLESALFKPLRYRTASLQPHGSLAVRVVDPDLSWSERVALAREILTWPPPRSDYGYVRLFTGASTLKDDGDTWPHIHEAQVRYNRPLLTCFVPDAFGLQLLTDAHLERANDLSAWDITPLGGGRHIVAARDLEAWYRPVHDQSLEYSECTHDAFLPSDPHTLAQARDDFGDMILTPEIIERHNPWR